MPLRYSLHYWEDCLCRRQKAPALRPQHRRGRRLSSKRTACGGSPMTPTVLGSIVSLLRYPVKSMMGEELNAAEVTKRGLLGDRAYALVDTSEGKVASAKNPRKWPQLFDFRAALTNVPRTDAKLPPVRLTLPDGTIVNSEQPDVHQILSKVLKREVTLCALPDRRTVTAEEYWPDI